MLDVAEALIAHTERQAGMIAALRSDLEHKQGIVTRIGGGDYTGPQDNVRSDRTDKPDL